MPVITLQFSGFPFSSEDAKARLRTLSRLGLLWTTARLAWGIVALTTVVEGWLNEARKSTLFYTVVLVSLPGDVRCALRCSCVTRASGSFNHVLFVYLVLSC